MNNIFIFSDSIGVGQYISPHLTWVNLFSKWVDLNYKNIMVQNASRNGDTTRLALERMPGDIQNHHPDYVIIQFGINDGNHWDTDNGVPRVSDAAFEQNIMEMIERLKVFGVKDIILNTNHLLNTPKNVINYNGIIRDVYQLYEDEVYLNDIEGWMRGRKVDHKQITLEDGVHLNVNGHRLYTINMIEVIKGVIKK